MRFQKLDHPGQREQSTSDHSETHARLPELPSSAGEIILFAFAMTDNAMAHAIET
ncbi:hypothetical protein [Massilia sp. BSC265]|uniref:hypothetical protein n=1 Tax=Massilia sp. BSC265 TaxID=1549812 RepID=UPI000B031924|nr:hypothetical protein [Massilia sp. BSC265]